MCAERTVNLGQWFHPVLNPPAFEDLARQISDVTDLEVRRRNLRVGNPFNDVSSKLEISRFHVKSINDRLTFARAHLDTMMADLATELETNIGRHRRVATQHNLVVEFRDHVLIAHLEGLLTQIKCSLDSLAQFYSIAYGRSLKTFSDKGKNVLKDLQNLGSRHTSVAANMSAMISFAKISWVDEVIEYRDELVHFGQLREFRCLHVPITAATRYGPEDVSDSIMPNQRSTAAYTTFLLEKSHAFTAEWLSLMFAEMQERKSQ